MAIETAENKGLTISFDDGDFSTGTVSVLMDIDMRQGTPVDETAWLKGQSTDAYPGNLSGFQASNTGGEANGGLRLVTIAFTLADAAEQVLVLTTGASKILGVVGTTFAVADKVLSADFTNTGKASTAAKTGGTDPAIVLHSETAGGAGTVTVMLLGA